MRCEGKTVLVTGAQRGIGRAVALRFAQEGADVALNFLDDKPAAEAGAAQIAALGRRCCTIQADIARPEEARRLVATAERELGPIDVLVNNAGIFPRAPALDMPYEDWLRVIRVNLGGTFLCSRAFAPGMFRMGGGSIVNLASGRALAGAVRGSHYAASKGGIMSLTRSLALEWAPTIRVNTVIPGLTDTDQPREGMSEGDLAAAGGSIPLGRIGQPDDIARSVCFLVSDEASYITGQSLAVNGGALLH
jgi:NAD(P)-dependent dehydrogenase (short-subunit alcohol dehydrogenase family)